MNSRSKFDMGAITCVKYLTFVFNFLFFLTGCGFLGIGIWLNVERADWQDVSDYDYITVANVAIAAGVLIIIMAFLGCCGAIMENKYMLLVFFIFLLVIFLMELGAGISAYVWRGEVEEKVKEMLKERIPDRYEKEEGLQRAIDKVQDTFNCCGVDGINDWNYVPDSCCKNDQSCPKKPSVKGDQTQLDNFNKVGCVNEVKDFIKENLLYIGLCGLVFAAFQITGMTFAMMLFCHIRKGEQVA